MKINEDYSDLKKYIKKLKENKNIKDNDKLMGYINKLDFGIKKFDYFSNLFMALSEEYEKTLNALSLMREITDLLTKPLYFQEFLKRIFKIIVLKMGGVSTSLMIYNSDKNELEMVGYFNLQRGYNFVYTDKNRRTFKLGEGVAGKAAEERKTIMIDDASSSKDFISIKNRNISSLISMPLIYNKKLVGVMNLSHPEPEIFKDEHKRILDIISSIISIKAILHDFYFRKDD